MVAVSFLLTLPIFLTIVAIIVQYALLVNAKLQVEEAAYMAGRAAVTALPDEQEGAIHRAARMALAPLSPVAGDAADPEGSAMLEALLASGVEVPESFAGRYTYALEATEVTWLPEDVDWAHSRGREVEVTVRYRFWLTVPIAMVLIAPNTDTVGGVEGRFFTISSTVRVQTAHGRFSN